MLTKIPKFFVSAVTVDQGQAQTTGERENEWEGNGASCSIIQRKTIFFFSSFTFISKIIDEMFQF